MIERYRPRSRRQDDPDVGYKRPPLHTRFKPRQSGNPKGRPKGSRNLKTDLAAELAERIVITEGGRTRKISKQQGILKRLTTTALKGDVRASDTVLKLVERHLMSADEMGEVQRQPKEDREILKLYLARHADSRRLYGSRSKGGS